MRSAKTCLHCIISNYISSILVVILYYLYYNSTIDDMSDSKESRGLRRTVIYLGRVGNEREGKLTFPRSTSL